MSVLPGAQRFAATRKPRAAIIATLDLPLLSPPKLTCPDAVASLWQMGNRRFPEIILAAWLQCKGSCLSLFLKKFSDRPFGSVFIFGIFTFSVTFFSSDVYNR
jgi:hypothetical protein